MTRGGIGRLPSMRRGWLPARLSGIAPWRIVVMAVAALMALAISLVPPPAGAPGQAMVALGLTVMTVALWATMAIPQPIAALLFLGLVLVTGAASPAATVSGFLSNSLWLVFGGLLIGTAAERTGFGRFIARRFFGRFRASYSQLILGLIVGTTILSFLVPANMGRIAITVPIVMALAKDVGYEPGSPGYVGLVITAVIGNFTVALAILPANLLNIMVIGSGETLYGIRVSYMEYLLLCAPVLGLVKALIVWRTVVWLYPAAAPRLDAGVGPDRLGLEAKRVAVILGCAILLWASDFLHGVRPGWVALGAGLACLSPGIGVLAPAEGLDRAKLLVVVWVGTVLSLGAVLSESGASRLVSEALAGFSGGTGMSPLYGYYAIAYLSSLLTNLATLGGAIPIVAATVGDISAATGLPVKTGIMSVAAGLSALFFPYVAAPVVVGLTMGKVSMAAAARFMILASVLTWLIVIPLNAVWWRLLSVLP
jgi:di/tricarboxylate transporter